MAQDMTLQAILTLVSLVLSALVLVGGIAMWAGGEKRGSALTKESVGELKGVIDKRFDKLETEMSRRLDRIEVRFDKLEISVEKRFEKVDREIDNVKNMITNEIRTLRNWFHRLANFVTAVSERVRHYDVNRGVQPLKPFDPYGDDDSSQKENNS
jgi:hypothetical protein